MKKLSLLFLLAFVTIFSSCEKDDEKDTVVSETESNLTLDILGLEDLGDNATYEGWIIVDGSPVSTGTFDVNSDGEMSKTSFALDAEDLKNAVTFILTIEPVPDADSAPSDVHILAGDFSDDDASLVIGHASALGDNFASAAGKYILATPTDGADNNENSGLWFLDNSSGMPAEGLMLPTLPDGWEYEGWAVIDGTPVTTGKFSATNTADDSAPYSSTMDAPAFPGEDFIINAPMGLTFPTDLAGGTAVISIEPVPDNSDAPFSIKPLVVAIANDAVDHVAYDLAQNFGSFPTGTASK